MKVLSGLSRRIDTNKFETAVIYDKMINELKQFNIKFKPLDVKGKCKVKDFRKNKNCCINNKGENKNVL